jgi:SAM-dependent methyltransferase
MIQKILDFFFLPLRVLLSHQAVEKIGLTSLEMERMNAVKKYLVGRTVDLACGRDNKLSKTTESTFGLDIHFYPTVDIQADAEALPIKSGSIDNIVILSSLEYVPNKAGALKESYRVLKKGGKIYITSINPFFCLIRWKLAFWNRYQNPGRGGFWKREVMDLFNESFFRFVEHKKFVYGLNNLYIGVKIEV